MKARRARNSKIHSIHHQDGSRERECSDSRSPRQYQRPNKFQAPWHTEEAPNGAPVMAPQSRLGREYLQQQQTPVHQRPSQKRMKRSIRAKNKHSRFGIIKSFNGSDVGQLPEINQSADERKMFGARELSYYNSRSSTDLQNMKISES